MIKRIHPRSSCTNSSSMFSFSEGKRFCFNEKQQDANTISIIFSFLNFTCFEPFSNIKSWLTLNPFFHNIEKGHYKLYLYLYLLPCDMKAKHSSRTKSTLAASQIRSIRILVTDGRNNIFNTSTESMWRWASWSRNNKFLRDVYEDESPERMGKILWRTCWLLPPEAKGSDRVWFEKPLWP